MHGTQEDQREENQGDHPLRGDHRSERAGDWPCAEGLAHRGGQVPGVVPRQRTDLGADTGAARQRTGERIGGPSSHGPTRATSDWPSAFRRWSRKFCYHFHRWRQSAEVGMHIDHKAGEKLFVDYAGDRLAIVDREDGKQLPVETFVAIPAASELTFVEASATQQSTDWIRCNERALRFCGGCPQAIIPAPAQRGQSLGSLRAGHQPSVRRVRRPLRRGHHARAGPAGARQGAGRERGAAGVSTHLRAVAESYLPLAR